MADREVVGLRLCGWHARPLQRDEATAPTIDGARLDTISLGTRTLEGCRFTAICTQRSAGKLAANAVSDSLARLAGAGTEIERSAVTIQGHPATRLRLRGKGNSLFGLQILRVDERIYEQMVECPGAEEKNFAAIERHFFDNLDLRAPSSAKR